MKDYPPVLEKVRNFVAVAALALLVFNTLARAVIDALAQSLNPQILDLFRTIITRSFWLAVIALFLAAVLYVVNLLLQKDTVIEGNVAFFDGRPVAGATVFVEGPDIRTDTDKNGNFRLVVDKREEWIIKVTYADATSPGKKVTKAMVKRKEPIRLEFPQTTFKIKGNVQFSDGVPCQGALVYVLGEPTDDTETNKVGYFELPVSDQSSWEIRATFADEVSPTTTISRNNVVSPVRLILPPIKYILSGSVHLADDSPVVGAEVTANGVSSDTNERGEFKLKVPERSSWQVIGMHKGQSVGVIVQRNEASLPIKLVFSPSVLISGFVQFADGTPADGALVEIETVKEKRLVDQEGFFEALANLKNQWSVTVRHSDYEEVTTVITKGKHNDVVINLPLSIRDIVKGIECERFEQTGKQPDAIRGRIFGSARLVHNQEFWVFVYAGKSGGPYWLQGGTGGNFEEISREVTESGEWLVKWGVNDIYLGEEVRDVRAVALKQENKAMFAKTGYMDSGTRKIESLLDLPKHTVLSPHFDPYS